MPKKRHYNKTMKKYQQQDDLRRAKQASMEQLLKERNLYRPGIKVKEMQELCRMIEQSQLDYEMYQQFNGSFPEPFDSQSKPNDSSDQPPPHDPIKSSEDLFSPLASPERDWNAAAEQVLSRWMAEDSDSDGFYSPEFPGSCCLRVHTVQVEVHPEPCSVDKEVVVQHTISPRKRQMVPAKAWDSIDEL